MKTLVKFLQNFLIATIKGYQYFISPWFPASCRFIPTCSDYAKQCVIRHGPFKGGFLTILRLLKCRPFGGRGYDPVPKNK